MKLIRKTMLFAISIFVLLTFATQAQPGIDNYNIEVIVNDTANRLDIKCEMTVSGYKPGEYVEFELTDEAVIGEVSSYTANDTLNLEYSDAVKVLIPEIAPDIEDIKIDFEYTLPLTGFYDGILYFDRGHRWYPLIPDQLADVTLTVVSERDKYIYINPAGRATARIGQSIVRATWYSPHPVFKIPLVIAETGKFFTLDPIDQDCTVDFYLTDSLDPEKAAFTEEACRAFNFFSERIDDLPHNGLVYTECMEGQGINIGTGMIALSDTAVMQINEGIYNPLYLTIAAQWFGAGVFGEFKGPGFWFITLSIPHHLRLLYIEEQFGAEEFREGLDAGIADYRSVENTENDMPLIEIENLNSAEIGKIIYGKGPHLLDLLRNKIGRDNYWGFIRELYQEFAGNVMTIDDFIGVLAKYDSNTAEKFKQLLSMKGLPQMNDLK